MKMNRKRKENIQLNIMANPGHYRLQLLSYPRCDQKDSSMIRLVDIFLTSIAHEWDDKWLLRHESNNQRSDYHWHTCSNNQWYQICHCYSENIEYSICMFFDWDAAIVLPILWYQTLHWILYSTFRLRFASRPSTTLPEKVERNQ